MYYYSTNQTKNNSYSRFVYPSDLNKIKERSYIIDFNKMGRKYVDHKNSCSYHRFPSKSIRHIYSSLIYLDLFDFFP